MMECCLSAGQPDVERASLAGGGEQFDAAFVIFDPVMDIIQPQSFFDGSFVKTLAIVA